MSIYQILSDNYAAAFPKNSYIAPNIPEKKLNGAIKGMDKSLDPDAVIVIYDSTLFGGAEDGMMFTNDTLYYHLAFNDIFSVKYSEITSVELKKDVSKNKKGEEVVKEYVKVTSIDAFCTIDESEIKLKNLANLISMLKDDISHQNIDDIRNIPLEDMPSAVKIAYLKIIVNFTFSDDNTIDAEEMKEIYSLMQRLNFTQEDRFAITSYLEHHDISNDTLLETIFTQLNEVTRKSFSPSLLKDLIAILTASKQGTVAYANSPFIMMMAKKLNVPEEVLKVIKKSIDNDRKIYDPAIDDKGLSKGFSEIIAGAGSVGIPVAALYFSGAVTGLGATGITSGLASLGFGGALGFSSMATGIGVLLLLGYGTHKGIKVLTGSNEIEARMQKEKMLIEVGKHQQRTINSLIQDINHIAKMIEAAFSETAKLKLDRDSMVKEMKQLVARLKQISDANKAMSKDFSTTENCAMRTRLPRSLDIKRLEAITDSPTTKKFYQPILNCYEETTENVGSQEKPEAKTVWRQKQNLSNENVALLSELLTKLGYFSTSSLVKGIFK